VEYLKHLRDTSEDRELTRCLASLALMRYETVDSETTLPILKHWLDKSNHKEKVSQRLKAVFDDMALLPALASINSLSQCIKTIDKQCWNDIKKRISDLIRDSEISPNELPTVHREARRLQEVMRSELWQATARDEVLSPNLANLLVSEHKPTSQEHASKDIKTTPTTEVDEQRITPNGMIIMESVRIQNDTILATQDKPYIARVGKSISTFEEKDKISSSTERDEDTAHIGAERNAMADSLSKQPE